MKPTIAVIVPTYGHFEYAARAVESAYHNTTACVPRVVVVDDASPEWVILDEEDAPGRLRSVLEAIPPENKYVHRFDKNGGLTRSWNTGLDVAASLRCDYACCGNSDLIFTPGWDRALILALQRGAALVGPVTNAPGSEATQNIRQHWPDYQLRDDHWYLSQIAEALWAEYEDTFKAATLNGFCMVARTEVWHSNAYDRDNVFCPRNDFNSRGQRNPTPLMTLNEYELQRRWHKAGLKTGYCPGSFVFHYRSVSRGDQFAKGQSYRIGKAD